MDKPARVLVVEDGTSFLNFFRSMLKNASGVQLIGEAQDGSTAVQLTEELQPDLVLLDIGLPRLNGIEAARRIRDLAPDSRILFVSENRSFAVVKEALRLGNGYLLKSDSHEELLPAVFSVLLGNQYISPSFAGLQPDQRLAISGTEIARCHEVGFYSDDRRLLEDVTVFVASALLAGNPAIVMATEAHREALLPRLKSYGVDIGGAIQQGRYIAIDAADALAQFMIDGMPDPDRFMTAFGELLLQAEKAANREHTRVAVFGECVQILCAAGNVEAAIAMEKLGNRLPGRFRVDILCGYSRDLLAGVVDGQIHERICGAHSAVRFDSGSA